jgi:peptidoglycan/xylan/chitin deacetylase (PgdA/CDA1 family)
MIHSIQKFVRTTDDAVAGVYLSLFRERGALLSFLFHSLFADEAQIARNLVDPLQRTTVSQFRELIEYYLAHGYRFVSPDALLEGLKPDGKYVLLTFDDGYYNNSLALPILRELGVPALFFISTNHVRRQKCYWWDVLYRERMARGATRSEEYREALSMKGLSTSEIEARLTGLFGADAFTPRGDIDRPFTAAELLEFAGSPNVFIGNHTANHEILTNHPIDRVRRQVQSAQADLMEMTGKAPIAIAYPNGAFNKEITQVCREAGLKIGFTVRSGKSRLPLRVGSPELMELKRFVPHGHAPMARQCKTCRSDVSIYGAFRDLYVRMMRRKVSA